MIASRLSNKSSEFIKVVFGMTYECQYQTGITLSNTSETGCQAAIKIRMAIAVKVRTVHVRGNAEGEGVLNLWGQNSRNRTRMSVGGGAKTYRLPPGRLCWHIQDKLYEPQQQ